MCAYLPRACTVRKAKNRWKPRLTAVLAYLVAGAGDFPDFPDHSLETLIQRGSRRLFSTVVRSKRWLSRWNTTLIAEPPGSYFPQSKIKLTLGRIRFPELSPFLL